MPREKIARHIGRKFHQYTEDEWILLKEFRSETIQVLEILERTGIRAFVHGSVARGDIKASSDIDIYIPIKIPSFQLDLISEFSYSSRQIIMGTPNSTIRGLLSINKDITISFPLSNPKEREDEFYIFSGCLYLKDLLLNRRIAGVDKQLLLIEPDEEGYWFSSIFKNKKRAIKVLSLSQQIIDERIRVLTRRDKIGRTGLLIDYSLKANENFEQALKYISDRNPIVRRILKRK